MVYHRSSERTPKDDTKPKNFFRNDGSFLEMFKKMQNTPTASSSSVSTTPDSSSNSLSTSTTNSLPSTKTEITSDPPSVSETKKSESGKSQVEREGKPTLNNKLPIFGKRRGGKALPTGQVKKVKTEPKEDVVEEPKNAWSQYLAEVKKYRESACEEEGKIRPLVK